MFSKDFPKSLVISFCILQIKKQLFSRNTSQWLFLAILYTFFFSEDSNTQKKKCIWNRNKVRKGGIKMYCKYLNALISIVTCLTRNQLQKTICTRIGQEISFVGWINHFMITLVKVLELRITESFFVTIRICFYQKINIVFTFGSPKVL